MSTFCEKWEVSYMTKEEFIKHLLKAKVVLEKLAKKQDVYDDIEERMYEEYRKEENIRNETKRKWINFLRIIGIASACLSLYFFFKDKMILAILSFIVMGVMLVAFSVLSQNTKNGRVNEEYYNQKILPIEKELKQQEKVIEDFIKSEEMRNLSDIIPQKYLNLKAVLFLLEVLQTGRADSSKEAYNLYEEELHREKMQEMQEEQLDYARQTLHEQKNQTKLQKKQYEVQKRISRQVSYGNYINTKNYYHNRWGRK